MNRFTRSGSFEGWAPSWRVLAAAGLASVLFVLAGTASAATMSGKAPHATSSGVTAADDQYSSQHVVTPPKHTGTAPATSSNTSPSGNSAPFTPPKTTTTASAANTLPFTGVGLLKVVLVGIALLGLGVLLRRWPARSSRDN
jgi:hypothetical protein